MNDRRFEPGKRVGNVVSKVKEGVEEGVETAKEGVQEGVETAKEAAAAVKDTVQEGVSRAKEEVREGVDYVRHGVQEGVDHVKEAIDSRLSDLWWGFLLRGIIIGGLGLYVMFSPSSGLGLLARGVGLFLIADGAVALFSGLSTKHRGEFIAQGVVGLALGALLLFQPDFADGVVMVVLGAWALFTGASLVWKSRQLERFDRVRAGMQMVGIVLGVVGVVFLLWPAVGRVGLAWLIGIGSLIIAAALLFLARKTKAVRGHLDTQAGPRRDVDR